MSSDRRLHVFVLIDALGWQVIQGRDFLSDILPHRTPLRTVLGYSSAAIPTILTGVPPEKHQHWNLFYYDPTGSPFHWLRHLRFLPDAVLDHRITRKLLKEIGRRWLGLGPLFECCVSPRILHLFNWVEKRNIYDRRGIVGAPSIFDRLAEDGIPHQVYSYHDGSDDTLLRRAERDIESDEGKFFFVYLSEMDAFLHHHRNKPSQVETRLRWYDARLRELFRTTRRVDPEASLTVFSDHGMTPIQRKYDLLEEIDGLGLRMPDDYLAVYDSTMARFWFFSNQARDKVAAALSAVKCGHMLTDAELEKLGVLFPDGRYGELVFLLDPGCLFERSDFNGQGWSPAAMHGYHPDDPDSDGIFLTNQPPAGAVQRIQDVFGCMQAAMR